MLPKEVCFHHYNYAYPGEQPEGIRQRVRQGIGGPVYLEKGANVIGHIHLPKGRKVKFHDVEEMKFGDEVWKVQLQHVSLCSCGQMIKQDVPGIKGHEIDGICIERADDDVYLVGDKLIDEIGLSYDGNLITTKYLYDNPENRDTIFKVISHMSSAPITKIPRKLYEEKNK